MSDIVERLKLLRNLLSAENCPFNLSVHAQAALAAQKEAG